MTVLGKRKSRDGNSSPNGISALDAEAIFRRHFEAQFEPLNDDEAGPARTRRGHDSPDLDSDTEHDGEGEGGEEDGEEEGGDGDDNEWGGISGSEDGEDDSEEDVDDLNDEAPAVQIIDHSKPQVPKEPKMSTKELKAFMSSKVIDPSAPKTTNPSTTTTTPKSTTTLPEDAPSLLAQDLELRRLLSESHLFTPSHNNAASASVFASSVVHGGPSASDKPFSEGRTRLKATELRLQALGANKAQEQRMPMKMRKGMVAKAEAREAKRRREARENGVILERASGSGGGGGGKGKTKKSASRGRQGRGVDGPGIGRMRGAELRISESDVRKIEGGRDAFGRHGRR
ncbi:hypothetical protein ISF_03586 [Cordyceps fumosorosea ARSEF 2679]|uniref:Protein FAF1 n=1 Tax=Cordyceps fumosorosea (strain ARSEF 2679) TaxID=1081104 RepID=A0A167ZEC8_CORFA|nr:hypothetical protein ISF_03586 [Cordyceps fumosorosea ARSEF 2679]OAA67410.1 hypothetical protein ISF_03586 [Cordyceps fumosorosea ARSEF 2679]